MARLELVRGAKRSKHLISIGIGYRHFTVPTPGDESVKPPGQTFLIGCSTFAHYLLNESSTKLDAAHPLINVKYVSGTRTCLASSNGHDHVHVINALSD